MPPLRPSPSRRPLAAIRRCLGTSFRSASRCISNAPGVVALAALAVLASGCGPDGDVDAEQTATFEGPRNVLLISLDTLRADACSVYGYRKPTTPFLEELGERGVVFEKHMVNSNNTLTSHATILTGLLMITHQADNDGNIPLADSYDTLPERFQEAGFATVAIASHESWLTPEFGLDQGFDTFESRWSNDAPRINRRFVDWLEAERPRRFFAFLHYYDAHSELEGDMPYTAPPEYLERFAGEPPAGFDPSMPNPQQPGERLKLGRYLNRFQSPEVELPAGYAAYLRGCYDAGVAKLDADLRDLFTELERFGVLEDTLVLITSDHGEEFEDHGGVLHNSFYDEIMHVPLIVVPPAGTARPRPRVSEVTRAVDIAPTVLDIVGLPPLSPSQGRSLAPLLAGESLPYAQTFFGRMVLRNRDETGEYKLVGMTGAPLFFDLDTDPGESENVIRKLRVEAPERVQNAKQALDQVRQESVDLQQLIGAKTGAVELNHRQLQRLRDLGYVGE